MPTKPVLLKSDPFISVVLGSDSLKLVITGLPHDGWTLHAIDDDSWYQVQTARGSVRVWSSVDTVFRFLEESLQLPVGFSVSVMLGDPLASEVSS